MRVSVPVASSAVLDEIWINLIAGIPEKRPQVRGLQLWSLPPASTRVNLALLLAGDHPRERLRPASRRHGVHEKDLPEYLIRNKDKYANLFV